MLAVLGWQALTIWECETRHIDRAIAKAVQFLEERAHQAPGTANANE